MNCNHRRPLIDIAGRLVGEGLPSYVIAEAGVNHNGSMDEARRLIDAAKTAGADAVKFQFFRADALVSGDAPKCNYQNAHDQNSTSQRDMLRRLELKGDAFKILAQHARDTGVTFLATPFGPEELRYLVEEIGVSAIKIASPDLINIPLLRAACASGLPMIVSTGASEATEVSSAVQLIRDAGAADRTVLMHCVSAYPTRLDDARLRCIQTLRTEFGMPVGFSDHTADVHTGGDAVLAGACVLEKHMTLRRDQAGPDHFFSLETAAFRAYVEEVRCAERLLGDGRLEPSDSEREVRRLARGRIIADRPIASGQVVDERMIRVQRATEGVSAAHWDRVIGMTARTDIPRDMPILWSAVEIAGVAPAFAS